jgi:hypothetical protein
LALRRQFSLVLPFLFLRRLDDLGFCNLPAFALDSQLCVASFHWFCDFSELGGRTIMARFSRFFCFRFSALRHWFSPVLRCTGGVAIMAFV